MLRIKTNADDRGYQHC